LNKNISGFFWIALLYVFTTSFAGNDNRDALTVKQVADSCWKYMNQQDTLESKKYCEFLLTVSLKHE